MARILISEDEAQTLQTAIDEFKLLQGIDVICLDLSVNKFYELWETIELLFQMFQFPPCPSVEVNCHFLDIVIQTLIINLDDTDLVIKLKAIKMRMRE